MTAAEKTAVEAMGLQRAPEAIADDPPKVEVRSFRSKPSTHYDRGDDVFRATIFAPHLRHEGPPGREGEQADYISASADNAVEAEALVRRFYAERLKRHALKALAASDKTGHLSDALTILQQIANWEMPWKGYGSDYGSNGERDWVIGQALYALGHRPAPKPYPMPQRRIDALTPTGDADHG